MRLVEDEDEQGGERIAWEFHHVTLDRVPGYGFGIAVSGGRDNPHFTNGDPSIAISDVLKAGPAEGKLLINDRVISANNVSLEGVDYATAVQVLRDSGQTVNLVVKRRVVLPLPVPPSGVMGMSSPPQGAAAEFLHASRGDPEAQDDPDEDLEYRVSLCRSKKKEDFGIVLGCKIYVKDVLGKSVAAKEGSLREGDFLVKINGTSLDGLNLKEARKLLEASKDKLDLVVHKTATAGAVQRRHGHRQRPHPPGKRYGDPEDRFDLGGDPKHGGYPSGQNLYGHPHHDEEKNNLARAAAAAANGALYGEGCAPPRPPPPGTGGHDENPERVHHQRTEPMTTAVRARGEEVLSAEETYISSQTLRADETGTRFARNSFTSLGSGSGYGVIPDPRENPGPQPHHQPHAHSHPNQQSLSNSTDYGTSASTKRLNRLKDDSNENNDSHLPDPRFISFQKAGSVGIRLTGGNEVGIFVTAVQPGSPAAQQGLQPGDKILKVNDMDMKGVTREEAVLFLLSLQDQIDIIAQFRRDEYDQIVSLQRGDSFYIKSHFNNETVEKGEMAFHKSDVFHVVDTLHNGIVGSWQAFRMDPFLSGLGRVAEQVQKGVIPNKARAEEIATQQFNAAKKEQTSLEQSRASSGTSFFRRKRDKSAHQRRSKSLGKDHWEDLVWSESMSKFPAYERVSLRHPGFPRPVVIFGPIADLARERLLRDYPGKFASPQQDVSSSGAQNQDGQKSAKSGIVRLSAIREIMNRGKHALLDVTPNAVDKLNYAQFYPIVIFARADSKQTIKECRAGVPKKAHLSSKKLLEQSQKLEKLWTHVFTGTFSLANITAENQWYSKVIDLIDKQQTAPIWMSESKPDESFSDDFLFPMTSRLTYTSSPESDGEFCEPETPRTLSRNQSYDHRSAGSMAPAETEVITNGHKLARSNSDPSLHREQGAVDEADHRDKSAIPDFTSPHAGAAATTDSVPPQEGSGVASKGGKRRSHGGDSNYGFSSGPHVNGIVLNHQHHHHQGQQHPNTINESVDDLPLPPHPSATPGVNGGSPPSSTNTPPSGGGGGHRHPSTTTPSGKTQLNHHGSNSGLQQGQQQGQQQGLPKVPPKIDRQKKPSRRSATERLFGNGEVSGNYINSEGHPRTTPHSSSSLDRHSHIRDFKMSVYDAYDPYNPSDKYKSGQQGQGNAAPYEGTYGGAPPPSTATTTPAGKGPSGTNVSSPNDWTPGGTPSSSSSQSRQARGGSQENGGGYRSHSTSRPFYGQGHPPSGGGVVYNQQQVNPQVRYNSVGGPASGGDYGKPAPPPKTSVYKPVPPPKPKSGYHPTRTPPNSNPALNGDHNNLPGATNGNGGPPPLGQAANNRHSSVVVEGNYMNSGPQMAAAINGQQPQGGGSLYLQQHQGDYGGSMAQGGKQPSHQGHYSNKVSSGYNNNNDDDSGQGSSLDRDYNNGYGSMVPGTSKQPPANGPPHVHQGPPQQQQQQPGAGQFQGSSNHSRGQYYYNVPSRQQQQQQQQLAENGHHHGGSGHSRRDGLDLTNREYRGSAFELYKKPNQHPYQLQYGYSNGHHQPR